MTDAYLKIDGIPGESTATNFKDWIEVLSFSHGVSQPAAAAVSTAGGASVGRCEHGDFTISKELDKASPILAQKCSEGTHLKEIMLTLCRSTGGGQVQYMEYKLTNAIISSVSVSGSGQGLPIEAVAFNYGKIEWKYTIQKREGGGGGGNTAGSWNLQTNATK